ncbi:MAG: hypothetical protein U5S82_13430 [Gammaproteobacteria bacterium]|nr:hypothetical protein [Gammaproteobacteria bacterium]
MAQFHTGDEWNNGQLVAAGVAWVNQKHRATLPLQNYGDSLRDPLIFNLNNDLQLVDLKIILGVLTITMRTGDESSTGASAG